MEMEMEMEMEGEVTVICMDNSRWMSTDDNFEPWFLNQSTAIELYCKRKLQAHPDNLVGVIVTGEEDYHHLVLPTNDFQVVQRRLGNYIYPSNQNFDFINGIKLCGFLFSLARKDHLNKRIVVFAGGPPIGYTTKKLKKLVEGLKQDKGVVVDVVDFFHEVDKDKEKDLRRLVDAMNEHSNDVNRVSRYLRVPANRRIISIAYYLSRSPILPPKRKKLSLHSAGIRKKKHSAEIRKKKQKKHQQPIVITDGASRGAGGGARPP